MTNIIGGRSRAAISRRAQVNDIASAASNVANEAQAAVLYTLTQLLFQY